MRRITVPAQMPDGRQTPLPLYAGCHALVVGCSEYETPRAWPRLPNPVKDARDVAQTLTVLGWQVQLVENPTGAALRRELNRLVTDVGRQEDQGILIWFSGHGYTRKEADGSRLGYIVPVDAPDPMKDPGVFMERAVDMRFLEGIARGILSRHVLMVFDSCFSGAIFQVMRASPLPGGEDRPASTGIYHSRPGRRDRSGPLSFQGLFYPGHSGRIWRPQPGRVCYRRGAGFIFDGAGGESYPWRPASPVWQDQQSAARQG